MPGTAWGATPGGARGICRLAKRLHASAAEVRQQRRTFQLAGESGSDASKAKERSVTAFSRLRVGKAMLLENMRPAQGRGPDTGAPEAEEQRCTY